MVPFRHRVTLEQSSNELRSTSSTKGEKSRTVHWWQHAANGIEYRLSQRVQDDRHGARRRELGPGNNDGTEHDERVEVDQLCQHDETILLSIAAGHDRDSQAPLEGRSVNCMRNANRVTPTDGVRSPRQ